VKYATTTAIDSRGRFVKGFVSPNRFGEMRDCRKCAKPFYAQRVKILEGKGRYCSVACGYSARRGKPVQNSGKFKMGNKSPKAMLGKRHSNEFKERMSLQMRGANHPLWKGGIPPAEHLRQRRERERQAPGHHTTVDWQELKTHYAFTCLRCKKQEPEIRLSKDHVVPLILGGSNDISNIQPLCRRCNSVKNRRTMDFRTQ
jgi:5-methylcytosine-specific restriction endonuclease McrA